MNLSLTELQLAIVQVLWDRGEASVIEIHDELRGDRRVAQSTIATLLARLEKKNVVARREDGRQHLFRALVSRKDVQRSVAVDTARRMKLAFPGDGAGMVSYLLEAADLDDRDLARAKRLLEAKLKEKSDATGDDRD